MKNYTLTVRVSFEALDDVEAREQARGLARLMNIADKGDAKLQETFEKKPPRKVVL